MLGHHAGGDGPGGGGLGDDVEVEVNVDGARGAAAEVGGEMGVGEISGGVELVDGGEEVVGGMGDVGATVEVRDVGDEVGRGCGEPRVPDGDVRGGAGVDFGILDC